MWDMVIQVENLVLVEPNMQDRKVCARNWA